MEGPIYLSERRRGCYGATQTERRNRPPYLCCGYLASSHHHVDRLPLLGLVLETPCTAKACAMGLQSESAAAVRHAIVWHHFPAGCAVTGSCLVPRLRRMTGSTISPHCTQRWAANSVSPMQNSKSMQKSVTMSPPYLAHIDSCGAADETVWLPSCPALVSSANPLAMMAFLGFPLTVCSKYV